MKKFLLLSAVVIMVAVFPAEKIFPRAAQASYLPSTYFFEGETVIWKIREVPAGRFPMTCAVEIYALTERFNKLYEAGFRLVDLNVNKSDDGRWSLFIGENILFSVSQEHAETANQDPELIALNLMSRVYEALGKQYAEELTSDYQIGGKYVTSSGITWFGGKFIGRNFANGERFTETHLAAASRTLPFGTLVKVTLPSGRYVVVRVTDRFRGSANRLIDVSDAAADLLGIKGGRVPQAQIQVLGRVEKVGGK